MTVLFGAGQDAAAAGLLQHRDQRLLGSVAGGAILLVTDRL